MTAAEFKAAIKPFVRQYAMSLVAGNPNLTLDSAVKRQATIAIREELYPLMRELSDARLREQLVYQ